MPFKLIELGTNSDNKICLTPGIHEFGREKLLYCRDKRISRQHGELQVEESTITLKSLHINPCYYKKHDSNESEVLNQGGTVILVNGDKFGLLLDSFWYEILYMPEDEDDNTDTIEAQCDIEEKSLQQDINALLNNEVADSKDSTSSNVTIIHKDTDIEIKKENGGTSPSILNQEESLSNVNESNTSTNVNNNEGEESSSSPTVKRSHTDDSNIEVDVKKIKKESDDETSDEIKPGTSDQASSSNNNDDSPAKAKPALPLRERCMYGANCYRKNPAHFAQYSHPRDGDWGGGPQAPCPFGAACAKRDPRHWRDHTHPPGVHPPAPRHNAQGGRNGPQVVERHGNVFIINAHAVNFYDDHFQVNDSDGDSVDYDYEF